MVPFSAHFRFLGGRKIFPVLVKSGVFSSILYVVFEIPAKKLTNVLTFFLICLERLRSARFFIQLSLIEVGTENANQESPENSWLVCRRPKTSEFARGGKKKPHSKTTP